MVDKSSLVDVDEDLIKQAAEQLGIKASEAWNILVRAKMVMGMIRVAQVASVIIGLIYTLDITLSAFKLTFAELTVMVIFATTGLLALTEMLRSALIDILIPRYSALMDVVNTIR